MLLNQEYWYPLSKPTIGLEEIDAVTQVLKSGKTTMGDRVAQFEQDFAHYVGANHAIMVNSGSSADLLIAFALPAFEVVIPAVTWPTHVWSWKMAGSRVLLADVDPTTLQTTPHLIDNVATSKTDFVSLVHLMGIPCDTRHIEHPLTEDCCEALGANPVGRAGKASAWSFFFSHHLTTMEGGMITTNDPELAKKFRILRSHGWARDTDLALEGLDSRYTFIDWGFNVRPTEVAAAIGLVQLRRLPLFLGHRKDNFETFAQGIKDNPHLSLPTVPEGFEPSWFGIPLMVSEDAPFTRDELSLYLESGGVETRPILAGNLFRQPTGRFHGTHKTPGADAIHDRGLYLGLHPVAGTDIYRLVTMIERFR